jgi:NADH-ubiquinone oxidoreductase chain 1
VIGLKACMMIFTLIWARASFPRIRYDQLMLYCWTVLLPIVIAYYTSTLYFICFWNNTL